MKRFAIKPEIRQYPTFKEFAGDVKIEKSDLIFTSKYVYEPIIRQENLPAKILINRFSGKEPTDQIIDTLRKDINEINPDRIIAIGGGSIIDIAKILALGGNASTENLFTGNSPIFREKKLIIIPTTCGTGSEVTNISIAELTALNTKLGLANDELYPDMAVLIPEFLLSLTYRSFAFSSIDALVHATESFLSPKATPVSELFSKEALSIILKNYKELNVNDSESWKKSAENFLLASTYAGIAFGNAGCGPVHAAAYPLGAQYHIPHGQANQLVFMAVIELYIEKASGGKINQLQSLISDCLMVHKEKAFPELSATLSSIAALKPLHEFGITLNELEAFAKSVIAKQTRLMNNAYIPLNMEDILSVYKSVY